MGPRLRYAMRAIVLGTRWLRGLSFGLSRLRLLASVSIRLVPS